MGPAAVNQKRPESFFVRAILVDERLTHRRRCW